jgi:BirA family biotin operon repressor/biotin-[acetyl-CoA-carboxylase] ligase
MDRSVNVDPWASALSNSRDSSHNQFDARRIAFETGVQRLEFSESLASTNDLAADLARQATRDGLPLMVLTRLQTQGRGQGNHSWFAEIGSMTFSLAVDRSNVAQSPGLIPATVALAVCEAIEMTTGLSNVEIKWPNDIFVAAEKLGGILIESVFPRSGKPAPRLVIGIGINVNNSVDQAAPNSQFAPVSLVDLVKRPTPLTDLLIATVRSVLTRLGRPDFSLEQYNQRSFVNGKQISILLPDATIVDGIATGISKCGGLQVAPLGIRGQSGVPITVVSGRICRIDTDPEGCKIASD